MQHPLPLPPLLRFGVPSLPFEMAKNEEEAITKICCIGAGYGMSLQVRKVAQVNHMKNTDIL
jgi:hypothetical protein